MSPGRLRLPDPREVVDRLPGGEHVPVPGVELAEVPSSSRLHDARMARTLGTALAVTFFTCFATGLWSHVQQSPVGWLPLPSRPAGLYRITQGVHVATGLASVPLLLAKLWTVWPRFIQVPPFRGWRQALERLALLPLVAGAVFLLFSGTANIALWYPWRFDFRASHYWVAWTTIGALLVHIAVQLPVGRHATPEPTERTGLSRRGFLGSVAASSAVITVATVGSTVRPLRAVSVLATRDPAVGPQGLPVNRSADAAGTVGVDVDSYRLVVDGAVRTPLSLTLDDLRALPRRRVELPITCVEGWSVGASWSGVPVRDLLALAGATGSRVRVESLEQRGAYRSSVLGRRHASDPDTLLALTVRGEELAPDHGFPARLIAPNRPGVLQTKWVSRLVVL